LLQIVVLQQNLLERDVWQAKKRKMTRRCRKYQSRPWLAEERRRLYGHYARLIEELRVEDPQSFFNYLRMEPAMFGELVQRTRDIPTGFEVTCHVDSPSNETRMFRMLIECRKTI